ncbi:MAG: FKBP-type peptidyl-prolyl cis-trans isomerase [Chitinophaga sp.]|nr:FKBP-type peptidyl-prolyl cis-trans isomerase [Chitinophaga sp.]
MGMIIATSCMKQKDASPMMDAIDVRMENVILSYLASHNETAVKDVSGLYYRILQPGDSTHFVKATSIPTIIYTNQLLNGDIVGSSFGPTDFDRRELKNHIPGWQIGLQKISQGGRIRLFIPPALAYGATGVPGIIPPNAVLISDVELVNIR